MATVRKSSRKNAKPIADGPVLSYKKGLGNNVTALEINVSGVLVSFSMKEAQQLVEIFQKYLEEERAWKHAGF